MKNLNFSERFQPLNSGKVFPVSNPAKVSASPRHSLLRVLTVMVLICAATLPAQVLQNPPATPPKSLEISRPVRSWEFMDAVGPRAALLGTESGRFEAWVHPLKVLRNFHLIFHAEDHAQAAEPLARTLIVRPESTTIEYASDTFTVRETLVVPLNKPGAVILLDIHSTEPMEVEVAFDRDFQLQWPAALSDPGIEWTPADRAFTFGCERPDYMAMIGSPTATVSETELVTNYAAYRESSFRLGVSKPGEDHKVIALAATVEGAKQLDATYKDLINHANEFEGEAAAYYQQQLSRTAELEIPDKELQQAYDWARVNMAQAMVNNPLIGTGMSAGYGLDRGDRRPGYDWYFGRDAFWTALALDADGDFQTTRAALEFLSRYQRQDGKMPHEVPQSASLIGPLEKTAFSFASADATPLYLIAFDDYVTRSGDVDFARQKWASLENTVKFLRSTFDANHLAHNEGVGHGWVEGGPLFPVHMEFYQAGLGVEALRAYSRLARATGHAAEADAAEAEFALARPNLESFWMPALKRYGFSLDSHGAPQDAPSVEATVPIWFDLMDKDRAGTELDELAQPKHQADWGFRILADNDTRYNPSGYHNGSVWPLFTGWASVAEYRNHRPLEGYENLRANALLTYSGAAGHVTEVLAGNAHQGLTASTPHQTWSSAMVIEPLLLGMLDLRVDVAKRQIGLAPQLPANWHEATVRRVRLGEASLDFGVTQREGVQRLRIAANAAAGAALDYTPTFSPHARILGVTANGQKLPFTVAVSATDQRLLTHLTLDGHEQSIEVRTEGDVGISYESTLPGLGEASRGLRLTHESWSADGATWTLQLESAQGGVFELDLRGAQQIRRVEGGELLRGTDDAARVRVTQPTQAGARSTLILHLTGKKR